MKTNIKLILIIAALSAVALLSSCAEQVGWREFTSQAGGFSIMMPGDPDEQSQLTATEFGTTEAVTFIVDNPGAGYSAIYANYPTGLIQAYPVGVILDGISFGVVTQSEGELVRNSTITFDGYEGRELEIAAPIGESILRVRIYLIGNRVYQISVVTSAVRQSSEDTVRFFDSFKLLTP
ncbi:MAG: hypothetical protein N2C13_02000 [Chloroflexota bacterium]